MDFFTVPTVTFKILFVLVILSHCRRKVVHFNVTTNPTTEWTSQQVVEAFPYDTAPKYLIRDRDSIYGSVFRERVNNMGINEVLITRKSPWQNPYLERFIGTLRRELLDHVIILGSAHLERLLKEFINDYYHVARPHQGLDGDTPIPQQEPPVISGPTKLASIPVLGGLHHRYFRVAA